jgi:signal transduction histidine kinase
MALAGNPGPWLIGLYAAASRLPRRWVWLPGLVAWAGFEVWSWTDARRLTIDSLAAGALAVLLVVLVGVYLSTREALLLALRERAERAETERLLREEQARAAERGRIAREMHDVLAHKVSLIALHAGALELRSEGGPLHEGAGLIRVTAREALQELREVLGVLRSGPGPTDEQVADISALVEASRHAGQPVELIDTTDALPAATARVVYRVVQEGLTNAHKHAPGAATTVSVRRHESGVIEVIVHNGLVKVETPVLPPSGFGLVGLRERIRLVGGTVYSGRKGEGWELRAEVPWLGNRVEAG